MPLHRLKWLMRGRFIYGKKDLRSPWTAEVLGNSGEITD